jgi:CubicO group peptidase (beta-lactamase class C family)
VSKKIKLYAPFLLVSLAFGQKREYPSPDWKMTSPEEQGVDSAKITEAITYLNSQMDASETVVIRHGFLIHRGKNSKRVHGLWSCSKSFTSSVLGYLVETGKANLEDPASKFASTLKSKYSNVTLKQFATMTSGYDASGGRYGPSQRDGSKTPFVAASPSFNPGTHFAYWDDAQRMFGAVLTKIAGKNFSTVFNDNIAKKIGMSLFWSNRDGSYGGIKVDDSAGGVNANAENVAKYLYLFLNKGKWKESQVMSESWVREATKVQVPSSTPAHNMSQNYEGPGVYGYNWWVNGTRKDGKLMWPDATRNTYMCIGAKANWGFVIPEWDMVIVRLGTDGKNSGSIQNEFLKRVKRSLKN